jgi:sulfur carrier protein
VKVTAMRVTVNGEATELPVGSTIADLIARLELEPRGIAVAVDGEVVTRRTWAERSLAEDETVEILSIAQGG